MIKGFKMKLYNGCEKEYQKRHDEIWPEMVSMIHRNGGKNYTIFWDRETNDLFACLEIEDPEKWNRLGDNEVRRRWWDYMADIMETNADNSPVSVDLVQVFHLE